MKRRFFTAGALICLAAGVASGVLWVRSHRTLESLDGRDSISLTHRDALYWIVSEHGRAVLCRQTGRNWREAGGDALDDGARFAATGGTTHDASGGMK